MAGSLQDFEFYAGCCKSLSFAKQAIRRRARHWKPKRCRQVEVWIHKFFCIAGADHQRTLGPAPLHLGIARDVVAVTVGTYDGCRRERIFFEILNDSIRLEAWIEHDA